MCCLNLFPFEEPKCSFTSVTMIGFGDFVPGLEQSDTIFGTIMLMVTCVYLLFGLAIIAMVIAVVRDAADAKQKQKKT